MSDDLHYMDLYELSLRLRRGEVSPVEVTRAQLDRIDKLDAKLRSYATVTAELAMAQAREAEAALGKGECLGPLHGVPIALKDLVMTPGVPTTAGMTLYRDTIPDIEATVARRLREAGSVMLGKLQMTEGAFATPHPDIPPPVNPWHADHWTGASSSGSGVATAAGLCYASIGTDSGGSIRFPCAANGLTGLKPTWGRVSRYGVFELAASLDHVGPIARSARDVLFMLSAIVGQDDLDPTSLTGHCLEVPSIEESFRGLRIGVDESWISEGVDPVIQEALLDVLDVVRAEGGVLQAIKMPDAYAASANWESHCGVQTAVAHAATYPARADEYGPALSRLIDTGRELTGMQYQQVLLDAMAFSGELESVLEGVDLILAPVQPFAAPSHEQLEALAEDPELNRRLIQFTAPFNVSGHPCLSLPCGQTAEGLPIGFQFVAGKCQEVTLCRAGMALQAVTDWHRLRPSL